MKRLILAPHGDDEVLGCGGLLAQSFDNTVLIMTHSDQTRVAEANAAASILGHTVEFAGFADGHLGEHAKYAVDFLDEYIDKLRPDEMYLPAPDLHQDHLATYEAGMRAARLGMTPGRHYVPRVILYDIPTYDIALYDRPWPWNLFMEVKPSAMLDKTRAMECYASQRPEGHHPAHAIYAHASAIGTARGMEYAERYAMVRSVTYVSR